MVGKLGWFIYHRDNGNAFAVYLDVTNSLAVGFSPYGGEAIPEISRYLKMRYVNMRSDDGKSARLYCPQVTTPLYTTKGASININGTTFKRTGPRGERAREAVAPPAA